MNPIAIYIGLISYPLYLWHWPILSFPRIILGQDLSENLIIGCLGLATAASILTYLFIEIPIKKRKPSIKMSLILTTLLGSLGCFGLYVFLLNGLPLRDVNNMANQINQIEYYRYLDDNYIDCQQKNIKQNAIVWEGYLRCKQSQEGSPKVVLVGDSHAEHLFVGLADNYDKNVAYYISGLPIMSRTSRQYIFDYIIENDDIETVILTARYELHLGRADIVNLYEDMQGTVESLKAAKKTVVLVGDTPQYNVDPSNCLGRRFAPTSSSCSLTINEIHEQKSIFHNELKKLARDYDVIYIDLFKSMCSPEKCSMNDNGSLLYRDRDHLSILGGMKAGSFIADKLRSDEALTL